MLVLVLDVVLVLLWVEAFLLVLVLTLATALVVAVSVHVTKLCTIKLSYFYTSKILCAQKYTDKFCRRFWFHLEQEQLHCWNDAVHGGLHYKIFSIGLEDCRSNSHLKVFLVFFTRAIQCRIHLSVSLCPSAMEILTIRGAPSKHARTCASEQIAWTRFDGEGILANDIHGFRWSNNRVAASARRQMVDVIKPTHIWS